MNLNNYPEELEGLFAKIAEFLADRGIDSALATEAAFAITEFMRHEWGGISVYFLKPTSRQQRPTDRDQGGNLFVEADCEASPPVNTSPPDMAATRDYHTQLTRQACAILAETGIDAAIGPLVANLVRDDFSGQAIYINKGLRYELSRRDYAIWREWDGTYRSKMAIIKRHNISEVRFYQIINNVRSREFKRTQPLLPNVVGE